MLAWQPSGPNPVAGFGFLLSLPMPRRQVAGRGTAVARRHDGAGSMSMRRRGAPGWSTFDFFDRSDMCERFMPAWFGEGRHVVLFRGLL
jgi:hypothetical protein